MPWLQLMDRPVCLCVHWGDNCFGPYMGDTVMVLVVYSLREKGKGHCILRGLWKFSMIGCSRLT